MRFMGRRRQLTPEETAANAAAKALREKNAMTCQCCGHRYLANTGTIAHHGYQRPGGGWQTPSCMGAKYLPFEVDRDRLADLLTYLKSRRVGMRKARHAIKLESVPIERSYKVRKPPPSHYLDQTTVRVEFTRANFEKELKKHPGLHLYSDSFDKLKEVELRSRAMDIERIGDEIDYQQARYDGWKRTSHYFDKEDRTWKLRRVK